MVEIELKWYDSIAIRMMLPFIWMFARFCKSITRE